MLYPSLSRLVFVALLALAIAQHATSQPSQVVGFTSRVEESTMLPRGDRALAFEEMFSFSGWSTMVDAQFWRDNKPAKLFGLSMFRTGIPGLIYVGIHTRRRGRLLDVTKPRNPNGQIRGPLNPNPHPFLAEQAFLTKVEIVGSHNTLVLAGRYRDNERGRIVIPPTDDTLSFMRTLHLFERVDVYFTFTRDQQTK